ncbi:MAG: type II toxin-antitoxin system RelE/ParE family toxin [Alphaproteobacteria bacterium]|nr:type II toxin-antitoxin system RelE/ParE family toxin [Alphaproteobacteria bacterium]
MTKPVFYLTRQAARILRDIHAHSTKQWNKRTADRYINEIYAVMNKIAATPALGKLRKSRSMPFSMVPAGKHFIVYDCIDKGVVILTLLHQRRDIERIISEMGPFFVAEIDAIKKN